MTTRYFVMWNQVKGFAIYWNGTQWVESRISREKNKFCLDVKFEVPTDI